MIENKRCLVCGKMGIYAKGMCTKCYQADHYKINRDKILKRQNAYNNAHKEEKAIRGAKYYKEHPRILFLGKQVRLYYHKHPPEGYVYHHTCYDHTDPEANIVLMLNSDHASLHHRLRRNGIEISHINMER